MPAKTSGLAIWSLVLSLVGLGPVGVVLGHLALNEIKKSNGAVEGQGLAIAGLVIGYITTGLYLLVGCIILLILLVAASAPTTTGLLG
jgi:hypothetical protein